MKNEIVVGLDDSLSGKAALKWAAEHAEASVPHYEPCTRWIGRTDSAPQAFPLR
jgi:hypothetical protein